MSVVRNSTARSTASWSISMADNTACSASSEYGGRRSRYGSRASVGAIEYSTGELDIFPGGSLPPRVPEQSRGMICHDERHTVILVHRAAQFTDRCLRVQQRLRGERSERENHSWSDQLDLSNQIRTARGNLIGQRIAVARRSVLQNVADVHLLARQIDRGENFCE